jgi:putative hydrolase of the HAD superfamily
MIKAIIFDCFGVLVRDGWLPYRERYFGHDPKRMEQARELNRMVDAGLLTYNDFLKGVAELAGISQDQARREIETNPVNEQLFAWIKDNFKSQYKIGLLSNAGKNWLPTLFTADQVDLFDEVVLSYQIGTTKPDPIMYQAIIDRLGVQPNECLFIDDQPHYCEAAKAVGIEAIYYQDNILLEKSLQKYNVFPQKG